MSPPPLRAPTVLRPLLTALAGVGLIALTVAPPSGTRIFSQSTPPSPGLLRALGRSHLSLVADFTWIRAIGLSTSLRVPSDGRALIAWCDLVTDLDPKFLWPYVLGGLLGAMPTWNTPYNVKEANALLEKGLRELPQEYRLAIYLSFNQLHLLKDPAAASASLRRGAAAPGAPAFMAQLATRLMAEAGSFELAQTYAREFEEHSPDPEVRQFFARRRLELERDQLLAVLQRAADAFRAARGRAPLSVGELALGGFLKDGVPRDPLGGEFGFDTEGRAFSTSGEALRAYITQEGE